jgi:ribosomal protein S24E
MSMEVLEERVNPLLHRKEAKLVIHHQGAGTPDRTTVRNMASNHYKTGIDQVYVRSIATRTGGSSALCVIEVYDDSKSAGIVPAYVKNRNLPKDQRVSKGKKKEETPAAAPPPKPEKKAEAKPGEKKEEAKPTPAKDAKPAAAKDAKPPAKKEEKPAAKEAKPAAKPEAKPKA